MRTKTKGGVGCGLDDGFLSPPKSGSEAKIDISRLGWVEGDRVCGSWTSLKSLGEGGWLGGEG